MGINISDLYGKRILTLGGHLLGEVKGVLLNMEEQKVSHLLLDNMDNLTRSSNLRADFIKHSIAYKRVRKVSDDTVVVSEQE